MKTLRKKYSLIEELPDLEKAPRCFSCGYVTKDFLCSTCDFIVVSKRRTLVVECFRCGVLIYRNRERGLYSCVDCRREKRRIYMAEYFKTHKTSRGKKTPEMRREYYIRNRERILKYNKLRYQRLKKEKKTHPHTPVFEF